MCFLVLTEIEYLGHQWIATNTHTKVKAITEVPAPINKYIWTQSLIP